MAKKQKTEETEPSTALVRKAPEDMEPWERALWDDAQKATEQEAGVGGGNFFSIRAGVLTMNKNPIPGNEIAVVVLDSVILKTFYTKNFDSETMAPPDCYAFGRDPVTLAPFKDVHKPCAAKCADCEHNAFGTANGGTRKGKACADRRRLAVIAAGTMSNGMFSPSTQPDVLRKAELAYFTLPPTSLKAFADYVRGLKASVQRPPYAVYTLIKVRPDPQKQVAVDFSMLATAGKDAVPVLSERHREAEEKIVFGFPQAGAASEGAPVEGTKPRNKFSK